MLPTGFEHAAKLLGREHSVTGFVRFHAPIVSSERATILARATRWRATGEYAAQSRARAKTSAFPTNHNLWYKAALHTRGCGMRLARNASGWRKLSAVLCLGARESAPTVKFERYRLHGGCNARPPLGVFTQSRHCVGCIHPIFLRRSLPPCDVLACQPD